MPGLRIADAADTPPEHPATASPIVTDTAVPASPGQLSIQPYWSLDLVAGKFSPNWRRVSAGGNFRSMQIPVKITYGLVQNLEIYSQFSFIHNWANGVDGSGGSGRGAASFSGVGDLAVTLKYQLLEETERCPTVSAIFTTAFPTGHYFHTNQAKLGMDVLGSGAYTFTGGFNLSKWLGPVYLYTNLWYSIANWYPRSSPNMVPNPLMTSVLGQDQITWNLAGELPLTGPWVAFLEFYSSWGTGPLSGQSHQASSHLMGVLPGIEYIINSRWSCELGVAIDLAGKNSLYGYTPIFTVTMTF